MSDRLARALWKISDGVCGKACYNWYPTEFKYDLKAEGYLKMVKNLKNITDDRKNWIFNYLTLACECAFKTFLNKYNKYQRTKKTIAEFA